MRIRQWLFVLAVTLSALYPGRRAYANGRFPEAQQIALVPRGADPNLIVLRTTFGIVVSRDAGKSWNWICERALGFTGEWDPPVAITKDGRIWLGLVDGLRSTVDGCGSDEVAAFHGQRITDLAVDPSGENLLILVSPIDGPASVAVLHKSGKIEKVAGAFPGMELKTGDIAPSGKIYVTAVPFQQTNPRAHLFVASPGKPFVEVKQQLPNDAILYLSAIDSKNDARVVIRTLAPGGTDVIVSDDGGKTFKTTLHVGTLLFGFAKSDDGRIMYVGSGDANDGIYESRDAGATWTQVSKTSSRCLALAGDLLYACSTPYRPNGFAIASSTDHGRSFVSLNAFKDIVGAVACDGGEGAACESAWPAQKSILDPKPRDTSAVTDASMLGPDAGVAQSTAAKSCGCRAVGSSKAGSSELALLLLMLGILLTRVDRRRTSFEPSMNHAIRGEPDVREISRRSHM